MISNAPWAASSKHLVHRALSLVGLELERSAISGRLRLHKQPRIGRSHTKDVNRILGSHVGCVFDVGANVGQSAVQFARAFPGATVYCFEPDTDSFEALTDRTASYTQIKAFRIALGERRGSATLFVNRSRDTNSLLPSSPDAAPYLAEPDVLETIASREVPVTTIDEFCATQNVRQIDLLKLDVQGYELHVLAGAGEMIRRRSVSVVYVEVSFVPYYVGQPLFPDIYNKLFELGYRLVGIYESSFRTHYFQVGGNALFVREDLGARPKA